MFKKYVNITNIVTIIVILLIGYCLHLLIPSDDPAPVTVIKYNGEKVLTSLGDHGWMDKNAGSSYETGGEYTVGLNTDKFVAKPKDKINIIIPKNPNKVTINRIIDNKYTNYGSNEYSVSKNGKEYSFTLPSEKGEYVFRVFADWDNRHCTSTIFRVEIE